MRWRAAALVIAALIVAPPFPAQAQWRRVYGHGATSCGKLTQEREAQSLLYASMGSWVLGYLTAFNMYGLKEDSDIGRGQIEPEAMLAWIANYCQANPLDQLSQAALALIKAVQTKTKTR
jgi:hypothetical protein